jgi:1L-myo-inositol 1-phosphate cytidylyltransferase / CDP-L-myo-inositol myo-inositolphosphotransferase
MKAPRTLALGPPGNKMNDALPPESVLLGLPILRRTVLAARRAGFVRVLVAGASPESPLGRALRGTAAELLPAGSALPPEALLLPWNIVLRTGELKELFAGRAPSGLGVAIESAADIPRAETWLLQGLIKDTEGLLSRHVHRRISLALSRRLAATRLTPNGMTLVSVAVGLAGALFFLSPKASGQTVGALLFLLHSILDGCDGELARLKLQESRLGGLLDFWGDNVVHCAVFTAIAVGWSRSTGAPWPLLLGAVAVAGALASAGLIVRETMAEPKEGPLFTSVTTTETLVSRVADALARRDFIYLVLVLSLFGKANWFLGLSAVGAPAYFLVLVALRRHSERKTK